MDDRSLQVVTVVLAVIAAAAGYGLGGWMEYRKGFETGIQTALQLAHSRPKE